MFLGFLHLEFAADGIHRILLLAWPSHKFVVVVACKINDAD